MFKFKLKRKDMQKYSNFDKESIFTSKNEFSLFLSKIEKELYNHKFKSDKRYVCLGRSKILIDEMQELNYSKKKCEEKKYDKCPTIWCFYSLIELITYTNFMCLADYEKMDKVNNFYSDKNMDERRKIYDEYYKEDIICLEERDCILHVLNLLKESLKYCDDNMEWIK